MSAQPPDRPPACGSALDRHDVEAYALLVEQVVFARDALEYERLLASAFECGRALLGRKANPDDIIDLHHQALQRLGAAHPELRLGEIAERLTLPLMEISMSHGLAFREQMESRFRAIVDARLEQSSKLEALGTLAAGIAHDFNNILGCIVGFTELTQNAVPEGSRGRENLHQILAACARAGDLVRRMLDFARAVPSAPRHHDLVAQVREVLAMLANMLGKGIALEFDSSLPTATILADPGQIQQVIMNLCINAAEAMNGRGTIRLALHPARSAGGAVPPGLADGYCLSVADHGCGMLPEVQARVFDPFFTTKAPQGSGLGLSVTHSIVTQLGGEITLSSRSSGPDTGTEFRVFLPRAAQPGGGPH